MSLRARIFLLTIAVTSSIVAALFVLQLGNVVDSWLAGSEEIAQLAGQQVKQFLIVRLQESAAAGNSDDPTQEWTKALREDRGLASLLETTMAQARSIIEISVADQRRIVISSSNPLSIGNRLLARPELEELRTAGSLRRMRAIFEGASDYEHLIPLGLPGRAKPVFTIQVLVSSVLLRDELEPAMKRVAGWGGGALLASALLAWLSSRLAVRNLSRISASLDRISQGQTILPAAESPSSEVAAIQSKLAVLGHEFRGAAELRANVQAILQGLEDAILLFDPDGRVMLSGGAVESILGSTPDRLRGQTIDNALPAQSSLETVARKAFETRTPLRDVNVENSSGALLLVSIEFTPDSDDPERATALVRIRNAAGHHELESRLGGAARQDAMSRITSSVAHEIKNPLNAIAVRLDNLQSWATSDFPEAEDDIQLIAQEVNRLDRVVRTFLDFTRPVELANEPVDVAALAQEAAHLLEPDARRRGIRVEFQRPPGPVHVRGDRDLLEEALMNIATNAIEAMSEGGLLSIRVLGAGSNCSVEIGDTGPGIPQAQRDRIFELYYTTKTNGSGLGLPMAFRAAQLHGGSLDLESEPGRGATFRLNLPIMVGEPTEVT